MIEPTWARVTLAGLLLLLASPLRAVVIYHNDLNDDPTGVYSLANLDADWNSPPWENGVSEGRVSIVEGAEAFEGRSLRAMYPANTVDMVQWQLYFDQGYDELYCSFWIKFPQGFEFMLGGKVPGLAGGTANSGGNVPDGTDGFGGIMMWRENGAVVQYVYHPDQPGTYGEDFPWDIGGQRYFQPGVWHHIEQRVVINTPTQHDGIIQGWFDGELALDVQDFRFRDVDTFAVDLFYFQTHFGGSGPEWQPPTDQYIFFDEFVVSTTQVGPGGPTVDPSWGQTRVARWRGDKAGAFSMNFDDSMITQADNAVPALVARGLVGTWFINPATWRYQERQSVWEETCPATGQELANHTMNHEGAADYAEAEYEIGECARHIWSLRPQGASPLQSFARGGGTTWSITDQEMAELQDRYHCVTRWSASMTDADAATMIGYAQDAIDSDAWEPIHFHGIGGEWLPVTVEDFTELLDFLVSVEDQLWVGTWISVYKYTRERDSAVVGLLEAGADRVRLSLSSDEDPVLYDEPLTLITEVPDSWSSCDVSQGGNSQTVSVESGLVMYEAVPGDGEILLVPGGSATACVDLGGSCCASGAVCSGGSMSSSSDCSGRCCLGGTCQAVDAGSSADSGLALDTGATPDTGTASDTGTLSDIGSTPDAGTTPDVSTTPDSSSVTDTSAASDLASGLDQGGAGDTGARPDAAAAQDTGGGQDSAALIADPDDDGDKISTASGCACRARGAGGWAPPVAVVLMLGWRRRWR